jgi:putative toxin-antitoxin system antitoxin component (TIGR02293 family)
MGCAPGASVIAALILVFVWVDEMVAEPFDSGIAAEPARIARMLSLRSEDDFDDVALARKVASGLPTRSVTALTKLVGRDRVIGPVVSEATWRRAAKSKKPLSRAHSEQIYELSRVVDAVTRLFRGEREQVESFLHRPHPLLDGETPYGMALSSSAGTEAVLRLIRRAEAGVAL